MNIHWKQFSAVLMATVGLLAAGCTSANSSALADLGASGDGPPVAGLTYPINDTWQTLCYGNTAAMTCPAAGKAFYGQDAQYAGKDPAFSLSSDGLTVADGVTGLTWQRSPDTGGDGKITAADKLTLAGAQALPAKLNAAMFGGFSDWRLPSIKELYSLIDFRGTDPSVSGTDTTGLVPFINTAAFKFAYGDTSAGERVIDSQWATSTLYVSQKTEKLLFGVNFADGRIKGYGLSGPGGSGEKTFFVICVRGNTAYGKNDFKDNGDGTINDEATGLTWAQADSGKGMLWKDALAWAAAKNAAKYLGHADWRLPSAKELQSIVDYTRSPDTSSSASIDPLFKVTAIKNEAGVTDYPFFWTSTTHANSSGRGGYGGYVAFGRSLGYMNGSWRDVHGAGCQRSDPKIGDPNNYPTGHGPQGDAIRIFNYVRLVRGAVTARPGGGQLPDGGLPVPVDGGLPPQQDTGLPPPPADGGGGAQPYPCQSDADCKKAGACPSGAELGCKCAQPLTGSKGCIPACAQDSDCPSMPGMSMICGPQKLCVPQP